MALYFEFDDMSNVLYLTNIAKSGYSTYVAGNSVTTGSPTLWKNVRTVVSEPAATGRKLVMPANCTGFFYQCTNLANFDPNGYDMSQVTNMRWFFAGTNFESLDLSSWNVRNVTYFSETFANMPRLKTLNINSFEFPINSTHYAPRLFVNDYKLETIICSQDWYHDVPLMAHTDAGDIPMFANCEKLPDFKIYGSSESNARPKDEMGPGGYFNKIARWRDFTIMMKENGVWFPQDIYCKDSEGWKNSSVIYNY